jgi:membrane fusion protein, multidrug efflux system
MKSKYLKTGFILYSNAVAALCFFSACNSSVAKDEKQAEKGMAVEKAAPLEIIQVKEMMFTTPLKVPGELAANQQVDIYAKVTGFVKDIKVDLGSEVKKGQLLMLLEAPEITSKVAEAKARLVSSQATYTATKGTYDRVVEAAKTAGAISHDALDQITAKKNSDYAQYQAVKAVYDEVKAMEQYLQLRAPFDGIVTIRNVDPGAYVGPAGKGSEQPLITLQEQRRLRLKVSIPEANLRFVKAGQPVTFSVRSLPHQEFNGKIARKSGALDLRLRSEQIEVDIQNSSKQLLPGMVAEAHIPLTGEKATVVVPKSALVNSDEGLYLVKIVNDKAQKISVRKGRELEMKVEVFGNLKAGDSIVSKANTQIQEGDKIR